MSGPARASRVELLCTVRGCGRALVCQEAVARCAAGHAFDRARRGYWNLLQPQDRRAAAPGDRVEAAEARRRVYERGFLQPLVDAVAAPLASVLAPGDALLDVGCGEGSLLGGLASRFACETHGLDLSAPAIALAARAVPAATLVVANADRGLPYADASFAAVLSITARRPGAELRRVLAPHGLLIVAVPAPDDLAELRAALHGEATPLGGAVPVATELAPWFTPLAATVARHRVLADGEACADLLRATYRGQRARHAAALAGVAGLAVTLAHHVLSFRPHAPAPAGAGA